MPKNVFFFIDYWKVYQKFQNIIFTKMYINKNNDL